MKKIKEIWDNISKPIYTGDRLKSNLVALIAASIFTIILAIVLTLLNIFVSHNPVLIAVSVGTLLCGVGCAFFAGVLKRRDIAIIIPTFFCAVAFTVYAVTGAGEGVAMMWSLLLPIGMCYFISVKYGIFLSIYYTALYFVLFYSPLKEKMSEFYSDAFMARFPLIYGSLSVFTAIAMVQYHKNALLEAEYTERLNAEVEKQTKVASERADRLEKMSTDIVNTLAVAIDAKDRYTNGHSFRVAAYSAALARRLGMSEEEIGEIRREAMLHDIGKIGISDAVLNKPGKLTKEEFEIIKSHSAIGGKILASSDNLESAADVARFHHERYDGAGYPLGLKGEKIPLHARIVTVADAYDAMRSDRIYRKGMAPDDIKKELIEGRGTQFDPALLDAFVPMADDGELDAVTEAANNMLSAAVEIGLIEKADSKVFAKRGDN